MKHPTPRLSRRRALLLRAASRDVQVLSSLLDRAPGLTDIQRQQLENELNQLGVATGGCEHILRQPIPTAYSRRVRGWGGEEGTEGAGESMWAGAGEGTGTGED